MTGGYSKPVQRYVVTAVKKKEKRSGPDSNIRTKVGVAQRLENGRVMVMMNAWPIGTDQLWLEPDDGTQVEEVIPDPAD